MAQITWLDKIDGLDEGNPQHNVNAADMNQIKTVVNENNTNTTTAQSSVNTHAALTNNPHSVTKAQVGLSNVDNTADASKPVSTTQQTALDLKANIASPTFTGTVSGITKSMVGLGSVDNTSDAGKPVSTAQQTALDLKANLASPTFTGTVGGITKSMVGLGSVDNTADTAKPVSTTQQTALDAKQATLVSGTNIKTINGTSVLGSGNIVIDGGAAIDDFVYNEIPTGTVNGNNTAYTLANTPTSGTLQLYSDGIRMKPGVDFTQTGVNITMGVAPVSGIICDYRK